MSDETGLPKATVNKVIKDCLPENLKIAAEVRDIIADASLEFLQLVASEANDICTKDNKSLIAGEHVMKALQNLGFNEYIEEVMAYQAKLKKDSAERSEKSKQNSNTEGLTEDELYAQQQALFNAAN